MKKNGRTKQMISILILAGFIYGITAWDIGYAEGLRVISEIVEGLNYNATAVENKTYDIINTPILGKNKKVISEKGEDLRGNVIVIIYDSEDIASVTVYPYMREAKKEKRIKSEKEGASIAMAVEEKIN